MRSSRFLLFTAAFWLFRSFPAFAGMEIIAHRGAFSLAPENTLASQRMAYEMGADVVECDVRLSADGVPVILHDLEMYRTTRQPGNVSHYTLAQLKTFECGSWFGPEWAGEQIPTLAEMLAVAKQYNKRLLLDIKGAFMPIQIVQVIKDSGIPLHQVPIFTWWEYMTTEYTSRLPGAEFLRNPATLEGYSIRPELLTADTLLDLRRQKVTTLNLLFDKVTPKDLRRFHAAGFRVSLVYPPVDTAFYYQDMGVDQIWTDHVETTIPALRRKSHQWNNWATTMSLAPDQRHTWQDPDGDGQDNLSEYALGTDPLHPDSPPPIVSDFLTTGDGTVDWTIDLRENWSQLLSVTAQSSPTMETWSDVLLNPGAYNEVTPTRLLFKLPVSTASRNFYRLKFDVKK